MFPVPDRRAWTNTLNIIAASRQHIGNTVSEGGLKLYGQLHGCHQRIVVNAAGMDDVLQIRLDA